MLDKEAEGIKFLERDFNQCFMQMRHYDAQSWDICKFAFTGYTTLVGVAFGLYQYSIEKSINLIPAAIGGLSAGIIIGFFIFALSVRNRLYYVMVSRYVNENRNLFLKDKPMGFEQTAGMPSDRDIPRFFNWTSAHAWLLYIIATLNAALFMVLLFLVFSKCDIRWLLAILGFGITAAGQLIIGIRYLRSHENNANDPTTCGKSIP